MKPRKSPRPMICTAGRGWHHRWKEGDPDPIAVISRPQPGMSKWAYWGPSCAGYGDSYDEVRAEIEAIVMSEQTE